MVTITATPGSISFDFDINSQNVYGFESIDIPSNSVNIIVNPNTDFIDIFIRQGRSLKLEVSDIANADFTGTTAQDLRNYIKQL